MERTGHCSIEAARSYKRTSDIQQRAFLDIINTTTRARPDFSEISLPPRPHAKAAAIQANFQLLQGLSLPSVMFKNCTVNFFARSQGVIVPTPKHRCAMIEDSDSD